MYAKVNPMIPVVPPPKTQDGQRVAYVTVWADAVVPPLPSDTKKKAGKYTRLFVLLKLLATFFTKQTSFTITNTLLYVIQL